MTKDRVGPCHLLSPKTVKENPGHAAAVLDPVLAVVATQDPDRAAAVAHDLDPEVTDHDLGPEVDDQDLGLEVAARIQGLDLVRWSVIADQDLVTGPSFIFSVEVIVASTEDVIIISIEILLKLGDQELAPAPGLHHHEENPGLHRLLKHLFLKKKPCLASGLMRKKRRTNLL